LPEDKAEARGFSQQREYKACAVSDEATGPAPKPFGQERRHGKDQGRVAFGVLTGKIRM
jgi:hypothetical protein